ncbi:tetratricopeptide repeat protein [Glycocaulis sp.]|uniref:tetratricopeptide repeat protein n=1 Tax=Glycocaulis sp. TaxID=1969725 RepID=UPI003F6FB7DA
MIRESQSMTGIGRVLAAVLVAGSIGMTAVGTDAEAQRRDRDQEREQSNENRTFSTQIGTLVLQAQEQIEAEQYRAAVDTFTRGLGMNPSAYEASVMYSQRARLHFMLDNMSQTVSDFRAAINAGGLNATEVRDVRVNLGQILISMEQIDAGIRELEAAIAAGATVNAGLARLLAIAYAQGERYNDGLRYAEQWYEATPNKTLNEYPIMLVYYQQLNRPADELRVVREMVNRFPQERTGWQNLVSLMARTEQEEQAFEANKLMYLNGLFTQGEELLRLAQYYSFYDNPYRGATILEREMNAGRIERNVRNVELLANMWRQAAEFERALPVLRQLSEMRQDGQTALVLAEAHYQLNQWEPAAQAFQTALNRGGLRQPGEAWVLLGTARFNLNDNQGALAAFREGARFASSRSQANGWITFVNGQIEGVARRARQREQVQIDECRLTVEAERRIATVIGEADEDGRVRIEVPQRCQIYFNQYGEQFREVGMNDEQAAERREALERAAREGAAG